MSDSDSDERVRQERDRRPEPVRGNVYVAAAVVALASGFGILAAANPITTQTVFLALSVALGDIAVIGFGIERARKFTTPVADPRDSEGQALRAG